jgi:hypothetical protein
MEKNERPPFSCLNERTTLRTEYKSTTKITILVHCSVSGSGKTSELVRNSASRDADLAFAVTVLSVSE